MSDIRQLRSSHLTLFARGDVLRMSRTPKLWTYALLGVLAASAALALFVRPTYWLTCIADSLSCILWGAAILAMLQAARRTEGRTRIFWAAYAGGALLASLNLGAWAYYDVIARRPTPEPFWADIPLFLQPIPMMAAVALQPHRRRQTPKLYLATLNFLILLLWWIYLYSYRIFPHEYVLYNSAAFNRYYNILYILEFLVLLGALGSSWITTTGPWRKLYIQLFLSTALYTFAFQWLNAALLRNMYSPGSFYDVLDNAATCCFILVAISSHRTPVRDEEQPAHSASLRWTPMWSVLAALAVLSVPVIGIWTLLRVNEPPILQNFQIAVTLCFSALLAFCLFLRQRFMDERLRGLVATSQETLDNLQRVQSELVARQRLGSLGQLVAGAAHEINNPLTAMLGYADLLVSDGSLSPQQNSVASRIVQEARRARNLVSDLLLFARKSPAEKSQLDLLSLVQRAVQMEASNPDHPGVQIVSKLAASVPRVSGSTHQLFQAFQQLLSGMADRLQQLGGGTLLVRIHAENSDVVLEITCLDTTGSAPPAPVSPCLAAAAKDSSLRFRAMQATIETQAGKILAPDPGRLLLIFPACETAASASANN